MKNSIFFFYDLVLSLLTFNFYVRRRIIRQYTRSHKLKRVLDAGCGTGILCSLFSPKVYLGIDINEDVIFYARKKHKGYTFEIGDLTDLDLKQEFDLAIVIGVLHHLSDNQVRKFLSDVNEILVEKGVVIFIEAIYPRDKKSFVSFLLRYFDKGGYIRKTGQYKKLVSDKLEIVDDYETNEVFFRYAVVVATQRK